MAEREDSVVNSIIGEGAKFAGDIELSGLIRIDGDFSGSVKKADRILIGKTGRVKSSINGRIVVIGGAVIGDIIAEDRLTILSTAMVIGNIKAPTITIEEGVIFHGFCETINSIESLNDSNDNKNPEKLFKVDW